MRFFTPDGKLAGAKRLPNSRGEFLVWVMPRAIARFRLSIKGNETRTALKVELIDAPGMWGERRYRLRLNGREPGQVKEATLSEVFDRLRRWLVWPRDYPPVPPLPLCAPECTRALIASACVSTRPSARDGVAGDRGNHCGRIAGSGGRGGNIP